MDRASCDPRRMLTCSWYAGVAGLGDWDWTWDLRIRLALPSTRTLFCVVLSIRVMIVSSGVLVLGHLSLLPLRLTKDRLRC